MKKVLAFLLVAVMIVALAACGGDETSKAPANNSTPAESTPVDDSTPAESTPDEDSTPAESTPDESVPDESVPEESDEPIVDESGNEVEIPADTNKYVSYGAPNTGDRINLNDSVVLTGYNEDLAYGAVILYDARFGAATPAGLEDYAVLVAEYQAKPYFGYVKTAFYAAVNIPADGFVVVVHKYQESDVKALAAYGADDSIYPHGIQVKDITWNATFVANAPAQDGVVNANEYGAVVSHVDVDNPDWDYAQFAASEDYDIVADVYIAYDSEYLYYAVVVEMDYHYCPNATSLWDQCAIQVNTLTNSPVGEYISQHYDHIVDPTAANEGVCRQVGYGVTNAGESVFESYMGGGKSGDYKVVRDETNQTTTYEIKISWADIGFEEVPNTGASFGFSISINAREDSTTWKNVKMRNGGGIIGRNDWSKMATVVLK